MTRTLQLRGRVVRGVGQAACFTRLGWVRRQCREKLGFDPYPGTLNVQVFKEHAEAVAALRNEAGITLAPPTPQFCSARTLPVAIGGIPCALIIPEEGVRVHGQSLIEILAPLRLKGALGLGDGDPVDVMVRVP